MIDKARPLKVLSRRLVPLLFLLALGSCVNDEDEINRVSLKETDPAELIRGLQSLYSDSGVVKVKVIAKELQRVTLPEPQTVLPSGVKIEFYNEHRKVISEMTANYAIQYVNERKWEARHDVVVINQKGEKLNTERLIWDEKNEKLSSDQFVKISTADEIIYGDGFEANQDFTSYRIFNVKGRITVNQ